MPRARLTTALVIVVFFFFNDPATTEISTLSLHDALPIWQGDVHDRRVEHDHEACGAERVEGEPAGAIVCDGHTPFDSDAFRNSSLRIAALVCVMPHLVDLLAMALDLLRPVEQVEDAVAIPEREAGV